MINVGAFVFDAYGTLYDVQSVEEAVEKAFPGKGVAITQIWRMKQLEYSWLSTLMNRYEDFWSMTTRSLAYTVRTVGLVADEAKIADVSAAYLDLRPFDDAVECLQALGPKTRAILSNGSPSMLRSLVENSGLNHSLDHVLSVHPKKVYKPHPHAYSIVEERLGVRSENVVFVSSNGFDICGAKNFGFTVVRVARTGERALAGAIGQASELNERLMFGAMRGMTEELGAAADVVVGSLAEIPALFEGTG